MFRFHDVGYSLRSIHYLRFKTPNEQIEGFTLPSEFSILILELSFLLSNLCNKTQESTPSDHFLYIAAVTEVRVRTGGMVNMLSPAISLVLLRFATLNSHNSTVNG
jgi:hypothetical protein